MTQQYNKYDVLQLLQKLNELYDQEEQIIQQVKNLKLKYEQLQEDKELLQYFIMYKSNKNARIKKGAKK